MATMMAQYLKQFKKNVTKHTTLPGLLSDSKAIQCNAKQLVTHKSGMVDKRSVNIIFTLIWGSDHEILCSHEMVLGLIMGSEICCVSCSNYK